MTTPPDALVDAEFTAAELENSFPLDRGRRFRHDVGRELVRAVLSGMAAREVRKRERRASAAQRREASVETLVANLVAAHLNSVDPERFVAVSFKRSDYVRSDLCREALADCRDYLAEQGLIEGAAGFLKWEAHDDKQLGRLTRVRPTRRMREVIDSADLGKRPLTIRTNQLVRINSPVAGLRPMPDEVLSSRQVIEAVNRRLASNDIGVTETGLQLLKGEQVEDEGEDDEARDRKRRYAGDLTATSIYRAFKRDWESGGRFYGGWWMSFPRALRHHITINGEPVVELDYRALHPTLLFSRAGRSLDFDPYLVPEWQGRSMRDLGKRTFNRLLNKVTQDSAKRLNLRAAPGDPALLPKGATFAIYRKDLIWHLRDIERWFGTGEGLRLQYEDSELALSVMQIMEAEGIPVLPIHDSFIVPAHDEEQLWCAMMDAYLTRYGEIALVDAKGSGAPRPFAGPHGP